MFVPFAILFDGPAHLLLSWTTRMSIRGPLAADQPFRSMPSYSSRKDQTASLSMHRERSELSRYYIAIAGYLQCLTSDIYQLCRGWALWSLPSVQTSIPLYRQMAPRNVLYLRVLFELPRTKSFLYPLLPSEQPGRTRICEKVLSEAHRLHILYQAPPQLMLASTAGHLYLASLSPCSLLLILHLDRYRPLWMAGPPAENYWSCKMMILFALYIL